MLARLVSIVRHCCGKGVTPHILRHTVAVDLLRHGVDRFVTALWLGHGSIQSTQTYVNVDMKLKRQALAKTAPLSARPGRYRPNDRLLAFLRGLLIMFCKQPSPCHPPSPSLLEESSMSLKTKADQFSGPTSDKGTFSSSSKKVNSFEANCSWFPTMSSSNISTRTFSFGNKSV